MSCEVMCCEVQEMLQNLVEGNDGNHLEKLFSFLNQKNELDCYLAGYFEKILEMLFRKMTSQMMAFFNNSGVELLKLFLSHIQNYSIMQIVQRLMLPHLPFSNPSDPEAFSLEESKEVDQCNWSFMTSSCELLLSNMLNPSHVDVPLHVSDMLITVLQLSPPETLLIRYLCQPDSIRSLIRSATSDIGNSIESTASIEYNISLAAASVLESLISRLYESGFLMQNQNGSEESEGNDRDSVNQVHELIVQICDEITPHVGLITEVLRKLLRESENNSLTLQCKIKAPKLGHHGLQIIKLVESLTRIGSTKVDQSFCDHGLFEVCIQLFFAYEFNSVLHLSIQRIFVTIFEGTSLRM